MKKPKPKNKSARKAPAKRNSKDSFFEVVFDIVRLIPRGRATSYGAIAEYTGLKLSARMVGWAMNAAHTASPSIPAHRVVNRNGMLSGRHHFATPTLMEDLLKSEGVKIKDNTIVDFKKIFWDPALELL